QGQVAWHLQEQIAKEEDPKPRTENFVAEAKLRPHLEGGKTHVDTVQIINDVQQKEKWQKPYQKGTDGRRLEIGTGSCVEARDRGHGCAASGYASPRTFSLSIISATIADGDWSTCTVIAFSGSSRSSNWLFRMDSVAKCP